MTHPLLPIPVLPRLTAVQGRGDFLSARAGHLKTGTEHRAVEVRERMAMEYRRRMEGGAGDQEIPLIAG